MCSITQEFTISCLNTRTWVLGTPFCFIFISPPQPTMSRSTELQDTEAVINAKFNEFFESNGKPAELDDVLLTSYFKSLQGSVGQQTLPTPTKSTLDLSTSAPTSLISLSAGGKTIFVAQQLDYDWQIPGLSQVIGTFELGAVFNFELKNVLLNFVRLSITPDDESPDRIEFISYRPCKIPELRGTGTVVEFEGTKAVSR
ncbi:hypothetical protein RSAG8_09629, partial [Rhizoctonia solani AG-8 WAC10335]